MTWLPTYLLVIILIVTKTWPIHGEEITKSSLTFVIDDTGSMAPEIDQVKQTINHIFDTVTSSHTSQIENFVLATFNDPAANLLTVTKNRMEFKNALNSIYVNGGGDCPENALKGIKIGLENSLPFSYVYVSTDASAKDYLRYEEIKSIAQKKQIQITFLLTGDCWPSNTVGYQVYHKIAKLTNGQVFNMMKNDVKDILEYVVEKIKGRDHILVDKTLPPGLHDVPFTVDKKTDNVTISLTGSDPSIDLKDPEGKNVHTKDIVNISKVKIVQLPKGDPGVYTAKVGSSSDKNVRVTGKTNLNFKHGFSIFKPLTLSETSTRPAPDGKTFLSIELVGEGVVLETAKILDTSDNVLQELPLKLVNEENKFYVTEEFNPPGTTFKIAVYGYDVETKTPIVRMSTTPIERQSLKEVPTTNTVPIVKIMEGPNMSVNYNSPIELRCKINGYPKPEVQWLAKSTGLIIRTDVSTVEVPSDFISVLKVDRLSTNETYECHATNFLGTNIDLIDVNLNKFFHIIETPDDTITIEYDDGGKIPCIVDAQPPASVTWYKNGQLLSNDSHIFIASDMTLTIKNMDILSQGTFMCEVRNDFNRKIFHTKLKVSGLEKPKINKSEELVYVTKGEDADLECRILEGVPKPKIEWYFQRDRGEESAKMNEGSEVLSLKNVNIDNGGSYLCIATNELGSERYAVDLLVEYPPTIKDSASKIQANDGDMVTIPCDADGVPIPTIKWYKDDNRIDHLTDYQVTIDHSLRWQAKLLADNGDYTCVAENAIGSANKTVTLETYDIPHIENPKLFTINTTVGQNITMPCLADGYPPPEITWTHHYVDSNITRSLKTRHLVLKIQNTKLSDQGYYICVASNIGGSARIAYKVQINAPPIIEKHYPDNNFNAVTGDLVLKISCTATGSPEPTIMWKKDSFNIAFDTDWYDIDNGTLIIKNIDKLSEGTYTCLAQNSIGNDTMDYNLAVTDYPLPEGPVSTMVVVEGERAEIPCDIPHTDVDKIRWYKNRKLIGEGESTLKLAKTSRETAGVYSCRVSDFNKSVSAHIDVSVGIKPSFTTEEDEIITFVEGDAVRLICEATGDPELKVSWRRNGEDLHITEFTYNLEMDLENRGTYTCEISNDFGTIQRSFNIVTEDCILNSKEDFLKNNEPLLLSPSLKWPVAGLFENYMFIEKNKALFLYCQKGFRKFPYVRTIMGFCESETNINIQGKIFKYTDIKCNEENEPIIRRSHSSCRPGNTEYIQVGYKVNNNFLTVYDVCLDKENNVPLYTHHKLSAEHNDVVQNATNWLRDDLIPLDFDSMYDCDNQKYATIDIRMGARPKSDCCFGKRQLVNPLDLRPGVPTRSVYSYLNVVPHWSTCNSKNWENVEQKVRDFSKLFMNDLTILTGTANYRPTYGAPSYDDIELHDQLGRKQPAAQYLWKIVQDPVLLRSLAIIQVNVPNLSETDVPAHVHCKDICNEIDWMEDTNWHNVADGYTYCCSITDFESAFNFRGQFSRGKTAILFNEQYTPKYYYTA